MLILGIILKKSFSQKWSHPMGQLTELWSEENNFYQNRRLHFQKMYLEAFLGKKCHMLIFKIFFLMKVKNDQKNFLIQIRRSTQQSKELVKNMQGKVLRSRFLFVDSNQNTRIRTCSMGSRTIEILWTNNFGEKMLKIIFSKL